MKKIIFTVAIVMLLTLFNACAPVYKCGESKPEKMPITWSKNLKTVVNERDSMRQICL